MSGVDQAPVLTHRGIGHEPFNRARAETGQDLLNLLWLFSDMNMDKAILRLGLQNPCKIVWCGGPQGMRGNANLTIGGQVGDRAARQLHEPAKLVYIIAKPQLSRF